MSLLDWLDYRLLGNTLLVWASGIAVLIGVWAALGVARAALVRHLSRLASRGTASPAQRVTAEVAVNTRRWFAVLVALFVSARLLAWSPPVAALAENVLRIGVLVQIALWLSAAVAKLLQLRRERQLAADPSVVAAMDVFGFALRVAIWVIVVLVGLQNLGVNVTALMAGLGIGGVAVALAAQRVLSDVFASLSIVLDKPFLVGDLLSIDGLVGTVEHVGLKNTRLRSLSGEQLILSNDDLLGSRIRNFGRMAERRVLFSLGVTYGTPPEQLRRIPEIVRGLVEAQADVRFGRAHFSQYGDFALIFEIVYVVLSGDNDVYMDAQQRINLAIYERFAAEGIQFAFPTHTLHLAPPGVDDSHAEEGLRRRASGGRAGG